MGAGNPGVFYDIFFHTSVSIFSHPVTHAIIVPSGIFICGVHAGVYRWEENRFYFLCRNRCFEHLQTKLTEADRRGNVQQILCMWSFDLQDFIGKILMH